MLMRFYSSSTGQAKVRHLSQRTFFEQDESKQQGGAGTS